MWKLYATNTTYFQKNYKKSYIKLKSSFVNEGTALSALSLQVQPVPQRWIWRKEKNKTQILKPKSGFNQSKPGQAEAECILGAVPSGSPYDACSSSR